MGKESKTQKKFYLVFIAFSLALLLSYIVIDTLFFGNQANKISIKNAIRKTKEREQCFNLFLQKSQNQLFATRKSKAFQNYLLDQTTPIDDLFLTILKSDKDIMQIRYIDKNGMEKIRIEKPSHNTKTKIVENSMLQDKSKRNYFKMAQIKPLEKVSFSKINLNIENGKIEIPYKPTLRAMLPVAKDGKFDGVLVINYFMDDFLQRLFNTPLYDMILVTKDGSIIKHFDTEKSWSTQLKKTYTLQSEFPNKTKNILNNTIYIDDTIVSRHLNLLGENDLILIAQLNMKYQTQTYDNQVFKYIINGFVVLLFAVVASIFLSSIMKDLYKKYYKTEELNNSLQHKKIELEKTKKELQIVNNTLEQRIALEVEKSNKSQLLLTQHNKLAQMGEMLSMIAHQWRQPLSAISTAIVAIDINIASGKFNIKKESDVEDMIEFINQKHNNISDYVKFLSTTIDDFRNFFKTDKYPQSLSISSLITNALHMIEKPLKSKGINIIVEFQTDENITVNQNELIHVILNILKNSGDNFQEKKVTNPTIKIDVTKQESHFSIKIKDNGGGIDEENIEKIFEPYYSTKLEKNGTGLGLFMSKIIVVEHHKGTLNVYNEDDGVVFEIQLPV